MSDCIPLYYATSIFFGFLGAALAALICWLAWGLDAKAWRKDHE